MPIDRHSEESHIIRQLIPLSRVSNTKFNALCEEITVEQAEAGTFLFKQGDIENNLIYLLDGKISLQTDEFKVETIESGTASARFALAHQIPRKIDAIAESNIRLLRLNADTIKSLQNTFKQEESSYMVVDEPEENDNDWMTTLLKSPIFRALPPANLQRIIMSLEQVTYEKGDAIISQGEQGDYYYLIKSGQCMITRKPSPNAKAIKLGLLRNQDTFGEDSILSGAPRNVSVVALTDVLLLRLNKENFIDLIKTPSLKFVDYQQAKAEIAKGTLLMDVRSPDEYQKNHLENSTNTPFFSLRMHLKTLHKKQPVIVVCKNGNTSAAAAFLLLRNKINAVILEGGMEKLSDLPLNSKASFFVDDGIETNLNTQTDNTALNETGNIASPAKEIEPDVNQLKKTISLLEEKCITLTKEKEEISKKYKILSKQTEKLNEILDTLKKSS
jgi:CRP-like cAMP-binding protein